MKRILHHDIIVLPLASLLFLVTRLWNLLSFPIFNDEGIYLQYAQLIHQNFSGNKFISVHNPMGDWKPPLQYWLGGTFIGITENPLLAGRIIAVVFSLLGVFGIYYFVRGVFDRSAAVAAAVFYLISSFTLFYNTQFVAETFVFSTAAILYACCSELLSRREVSKTTAALFLAAVTAGTALVLFKQSGELPLYLLIFLPCAFLKKWRIQYESAQKRNRNQSLRPGMLFLKGLAAISAAVLLSFFFSSLALPDEYAAGKARFTDSFTMNVSELAALPFATWYSNAARVWELFARYYTPAALALIVLYGVYSIKKKSPEDITVLVLFLGSSAAVIFGLKRFNEYIYHTAVVILMIAILGRMSALCLQLIRNERTRPRLFGGVTAVLLIITASYWLYQSALMKVDSVAYLRQASKWAQENYLTGWPSGYGVRSVAEFLSSRQGDGIVVIDPQWGNPGTSLTVFQPLYYPNLRVAPMSEIILQKDALLKELDDHGIRQNRFVIFSDWFPPGNPRGSWGSYVRENYCQTSRQFKEDEQQVPIIVCEF